MLPPQTTQRIPSPNKNAVFKTTTKSENPKFFKFHTNRLKLRTQKKRNKRTNKEREMKARRRNPEDPSSIRGIGRRSTPMSMRRGGGKEISDGPTERLRRFLRQRRWAGMPLRGSSSTIELGSRGALQGAVAKKGSPRSPQLLVHLHSRNPRMVSRITTVSLRV